MSLTLHLLRHGQTVHSRDNNFCGSGLDPELTPDGLLMAQAFAEAYHSTPWHAVYASPLRRAIETARPLCDAANLTMNIREGLQEISYGQWEGNTVEEVKQTHHDDYIRWLTDPAFNAPAGGETALDVAQRALQVLEEIQECHRDGPVLVVSHKATIRILLCSLLGIDVGRFRFRLGCPVGSVSVVEFGAHGPLLHTLAERTHLDQRLRHLPGT